MVTSIPEVNLKDMVFIAWATEKLDESEASSETVVRMMAHFLESQRSVDSKIAKAVAQLCEQAIGNDLRRKLATENVYDRTTTVGGTIATCVVIYNKEGLNIALQLSKKGDLK